METDKSRPSLLRRVARKLRAGGQGHDAPVPQEEEAPAGDKNKGASQHLKSLRAQAGALKAEIESSGAKYEQLKAERLALQQQLGAQHGRKVLPRLRVEKTNGIASFVAGVRMFERIHARAEDPTAGLDGAGAVFASSEQTARFLASHGVKFAVEFDGAASVIVHAFKGQVGLVEVIDGESVRHLDPELADVGDIRPGRANDSKVPIPAKLGEAVAASKKLSAYIPRPYEQFLWSFSEDGAQPVLTRVDVAPKRIPMLSADWDERLGNLFDRAHARMLLQPQSAGALANRVPGGVFDYKEQA